MGTPRGTGGRPCGRHRGPEHSATEAPGRRLIVIGVGAALAVTTAYVAPHVQALTAVAPAAFAATTNAGDPAGGRTVSWPGATVAPPRTPSGLLPAGDHARTVRWRATAATLLGENTPVWGAQLRLLASAADTGADGSRAKAADAATTATSPATTPTRYALVSAVAGEPGPGRDAEERPVARLVALDARDGAIRWRAPLTEPLDCLEPRPAAPTGPVCLEGDANHPDAGRLVGFEAATGAAAWTADFPGRPALLLAGAQATYAVSLTPRGDVSELQVTAVDGAGRRAWTVRHEVAPGSAVTGAWATGTAVVLGGVMVGGHAVVLAERDGTLAVDRPTGAVAGPLPEPARGWLLAPEPDRLDVGSAAGTRPGTLITPATWDGRTPLPVLTRSYGDGDAHPALTAYGPDGATLWSRPAGAPVAACGGLLMVAAATASGTELDALDPATGRLRWRVTGAGRFGGGAACTTETVLIADPAGGRLEGSRPGGTGAVTEYVLATGERRSLTPADEVSPGADTTELVVRGGVAYVVTTGTATSAGLPGRADSGQAALAALG